jgi:hypothetical protein
MDVLMETTSNTTATEVSTVQSYFNIVTENTTGATNVDQLNWGGEFCTKYEADINLEQSGEHARMKYTARWTVNAAATGFD